MFIIFILERKVGANKYPNSARSIQTKTYKKLPAPPQHGGGDRPAAVAVRAPLRAAGIRPSDKLHHRRQESDRPRLPQGGNPKLRHAQAPPLLQPHAQGPPRPRAVAPDLRRRQQPPLHPPPPPLRRSLRLRRRRRQRLRRRPHLLVAAPRRQAAVGDPHPRRAQRRRLPCAPRAGRRHLPHVDAALELPPRRRPVANADAGRRRRRRVGGEEEVELVGGGEAALVYTRVRGGVCSEGGVAERSENRRERRIRSRALAAAAGDG